jgi:fatty-acyl-CoA synthase
MNAGQTWAKAIHATESMKDQNLAAILDQLAETYHEREALIGPKTSLTYANLAARVNRLARWARSNDLPGRSIALLMDNAPEYVAIWLGLTRVGCRVALINTQLRAEGLAHSLETVRAYLVITDRPSADLPATYPIQRWDDDFIHALSLLSATPLDLPPPAPHDVALYVYTSGTTGLPKAAKISHGKIMNWAAWFAAMTDATMDDRLYNCLPMYHSVGGIVAIGSMLLVGGTVIIREKFSRQNFWPDVCRTRCTIFQYIGELCRYLATAPEDLSVDRPIHHLRLAVGNGLQGDVWGQFQHRFAIPRIIEFYAATEGNVTLYNVEGKIGSIGRVPRVLRPYFSVKLVRIDSDTDEPLRGPDGRCIECGINEPGEALGLIKPGRGFDGYTDLEASNQKVILNAFSQGDRWFRTGDLMTIDQQGFYYFCDRLGQTFRWKGENVSTAEVERVLNRYSGITGAAAYGVRVPGTDGRCGMAAITVNQDFAIYGLASYLSQHLPGYAQPMFLRICATLDVTGTFKLSKHRFALEGYEAANDPVWRLDVHKQMFVEMPRPITN